LVTEQGTRRRAVGFLDSDTDANLNGRSTFESLKRESERAVRTRFDWWISGDTPNDRWFHGWPNQPKYKECFTFKWKENRQHQRLYGFLHHPQPKTQPRFQICVLIFHEAKNEDQTDFSILDRINQFRQDSIVISAIKKLFSEERSNESQWLQ